MSDDPERLREALPAYEIGGVLGRGGWGVVFGGRHRHLDREVAIKQLPAAFAADPAARRRFASEARVLASLDHPHVVPVYDYLERDDLCLLVMEQLSGGTLRERVRGEGLTAQAATAVALACAAGLNAAHARGVLHRDIKPENMLYTVSGVVKVTDFGIAKVTGGADTAVTRAGDVLGTAAYIAPEQVRGGGLSPSTDVYGLATMLYELLAGELPFADDGDALSLMFKHAYEVPTALRAVAPHIPEPVAAVVMTGLATDPAERFSGAESFATTLAEAGAAAWGTGWLARENVPVLGAPAVLAAAERAPAGPLTAPPPEPARPRTAPAPEPEPGWTGASRETSPLPPVPAGPAPVTGRPAPVTGRPAPPVRSAPYAGPRPPTAPGLVPDATGSAASGSGRTGDDSTGSGSRRWVYVLAAAAAVVVIVLVLLFLPHLFAVYPTPGK
jgi:predicted Ser/Thr protein kinase